jgi:general secretion pathway protein G
MLKSRGFSLIEIMITMAIVAGIILGIALLIKTNSAKIKESEAATRIQNVSSMIETYQLSHGRYPETLDAVVPRGMSEDEKKRVLDDPWNNPMQYQVPGTHNPDSFDLWSVGPNKAPPFLGNWKE